MSLLASLRNRIFFASALLAVLGIGVAIYLVNLRVAAEAERTLQRDIVTTTSLVDEFRRSHTETFTQMARVIADAPKLKAAVSTDDPPTVLDIASGYQRELQSNLTPIQSNLLLVRNHTGQVLAAVGASARATLVAATEPTAREALAGHESLILLPQPDGILQLVTEPISIGIEDPDVLGTVSVGFLLGQALAAQLKDMTGSDVAFAMEGQILAATLPREAYPVLGKLLDHPGAAHLQLGGEDYVAFSRPLSKLDSSSTGPSPVALILRSRTEQLRFLRPIHNVMMVTAGLSVVLATVLSFAVARTVTRPLAAITDTMREVAATGDLTRKIAVGRRHRWDDEDARLLATTFNTLTESIARFQREISQKERLTSLGRLSTVIAHEVRNPLMIIKASAHALVQPALGAEGLKEAVADINGAVGRLNRIVNEVLDFARPIRFELSSVDLNDLCRESAARLEKGGPGPVVCLDLDARGSVVNTDPERLKIALVNLLENARHAVTGPLPPPASHANVILSTETRGDRVAVTIADAGRGIAASDLPHVFDPYFTTRRGGTGLGLPIAKNIIEGLGGTIVISSQPGLGTEVRVELPVSVG